MSRRLIAIWFPFLSTERLERREGASSHHPTATILESRGQMLLAAVNAAGGAAGLAPGMTLANARAIFPQVTLLQGDPQADAVLLEKLRDWCVRYTPWVALDGPEGLTLDITGCAHLFGGETAMLEDLIERLDAIGFTAKAALADTPLCAAAMARFGGEGRVVPEGGARAALEGLPVEALRIGPDTAEALHRVGLHRVADILPVPRSSLATRFGLDLIRQIDRALGEQAHAISPKPFAPPYRVRLSFPDPIGTADDIARALDRLLRRMTGRLEREQRGCRKLALSVFRADGDVSTLSVGVARAARDPQHLARLFAERLATLDPGFGIDSMVLAAPVVEDLSPDQQEAAVRRDKTAAADGADQPYGPGDDPAFTCLLDRLAARLGTEKLVRIEARESHLPERAARFTPVFGREPSATPARWPETLPQRPAILLNRPERVDVAGSRMIDTFRWRGRTYRVRRAVGPERLSPEWWRPPADPEKPPGLRDYYRVEAETGRRFWLYRTGDQPALPAGAWFLHGLFA